MNLRLALYEWSGRHRLDGGRGRELFELAGYGAEPPALARRFWPAVAIAAGALGGLGVILWLAANWNDLGRMGRFALLQVAVLVLCVGAALQPRARPGLALMAMLCIGGTMPTSATAGGWNRGTSVAGLARGLFDGAGGDTIGRLMLVGLVAAGLLAASVSVITRKARRHG